MCDWSIEETFHEPDGAPSTCSALILDSGWTRAEPVPGASRNRVHGADARPISEIEAPLEPGGSEREPAHAGGLWNSQSRFARRCENPI